MILDFNLGKRNLDCSIKLISKATHCCHLNPVKNLSVRCLQHITRINLIGTFSQHFFDLASQGSPRKCLQTNLPWHTYRLTNAKKSAQLASHRSTDLPLPARIADRLLYSTTLDESSCFRQRDSIKNRSASFRSAASLGNVPVHSATPGQMSALAGLKADGFHRHLLHRATHSSF